GDPEGRHLFHPGRAAGIVYPRRLAGGGGSDRSAGDGKAEGSDAADHRAEECDGAESRDEEEVKARVEHRAPRRGEGRPWTRISESGLSCTRRCKARASARADRSGSRAGLSST